MTSSLNRARILVADDQPDVARTLCAPLRQQGATLTYVTDGEAAYAEIDAQSFDLVLIDMKMPPGEWGGLWLLKKIREDGRRVPSLVLSGEGTKRQTIEAMRYGAADWIDKSAANVELSDRCAAVLNHLRESGLDRALVDLPTPVAHRIARYSRTIDSYRRTIEGLHALETILRFAAAVGLATSEPRPLADLTPDRIARPSMGSWFTICVALADTCNTSRTYGEFLSCLLPDRQARTQVQAQVQLRNAIAHSGHTPSLAELEQLDRLLERFAHRASSSWRATLAVPTSMTYDGAVFTIAVLKLRGTAPPVPDQVSNASPLLESQTVLIDPGSEPIPLAPWIITRVVPPSRDVHCLMLDGVDFRKRGDFRPDAPIRYVDAETNERSLQPTEPAGLTWRSISAWFIGQ